MSDDALRDALLQDIIDHPALDGPRLIFADWLEEHGQSERAEFVRVQCELAGLDEVMCHQPGAGPGDECDDSLCPKCGPAHPLRRRERELLERYGGYWLTQDLSGVVLYPPGFRADGSFEARLPVEEGDVPAWLTFRRGFVTAVTLPLAAWLAHGPALVRAAPLERVELSDCVVAERWTGRWYVACPTGSPWPFPDVGGHPTQAAAEAALSAALIDWAWDPTSPRGKRPAAAR